VQNTKHIKERQIHTRQNVVDNMRRDLSVII